MDEKKSFTTREKYEKVITDRLVFGKPVKQITTELECSSTFVFNVVNVFNATKEQDWNRAQALIANQAVPLMAFEWAAERLNVTLPPILSRVYEERKARVRERYRANVQQEKDVEQQEEQPQKQEKEEDKRSDNTGLYLIKILEALARQSELLEQFMDVVLPKNVQGLKDSINANSDMLRDGIKDCKDTLEGIKINTRKRGL